MDMCSYIIYWKIKFDKIGGEKRTEMQEQVTLPPGDKWTSVSSPKVGLTEQRGCMAV